MRRIRLWHASVLLILIAAGLVGYLGVTSRLGWAWNALQAYGEGQTTGTLEHTLERQAISILQRGGSVTDARELLERSLAIDPNSSAVHTLGDVYLKEGNVQAARAQYEHYLTLDPAFLPSYFRLLAIYEELELTEERTLLLESGIDYFASNLEAYAPQSDSDVPSAFNDKAYGVYNAYRESLHLLRQRLEEE